MGARDHGNQRLGHQHFAFDIGIVEKDPPEPDVDASGLERFHLLQGRQFRQPHLHVPVGAPQAAYQFGHESVQRGRHEAHAEPAPPLLSDPAGGIADFLEPRGQLQRMFEQETASLRQAQRSPGSLEQEYAQFILQRTDLPAERRLRHVQFLGGARDVHFLRHGLEVA